MAGCCEPSFIESDLTFAYIIGHFRLNEMLLHVDAHKEGAEITYLVVILHLIDSYILNFQFRHHEHGRVESRLDTDIYFFLYWGGLLFLRYSSGTTAVQAIANKPGRMNLRSIFMAISHFL